MSRLLAIDYGRKRIGLAKTDLTQSMAFPHGVIEAKNTLEETIKVVHKEISTLLPVEKIIMGLPLEMSGKVGPMAEEVKKFAEALSKVTPIEIVFWDERLSSSQVEKSLKELDYNRKKRAAHSDTAAACLILQNYLDSRQFH